MAPSPKVGGRKLHYRRFWDSIGVGQATCADRPDVTYVGPLAPEAIEGVRIEEAEVVLVPSECYDSFPRTVVEAWAHGKPVLATSIGPLSTVVSDDVGWLANPNEVDLAAGIERVIDDARDGGLARRGRGARLRFLDRHTESRAGGDLLRIYDDLVASRST